MLDDERGNGSGTGGAGGDNPGGGAGGGGGRAARECRVKQSSCSPHPGSRKDTNSIRLRRGYRCLNPSQEAFVIQEVCDYSETCEGGVSMADPPPQRCVSCGRLGRRRYLVTVGGAMAFDCEGCGCSMLEPPKTCFAAGQGACAGGPVVRVARLNGGAVTIDSRGKICETSAGFVGRITVQPQKLQLVPGGELELDITIEDTTRDGVPRLTQIHAVGTCGATLE